jgi:hypothetical protein
VASALHYEVTRKTLALADREAEVDSPKQTLDLLHREVERLKEVNDGLTSANITLGRQHNEPECQAYRCNTGARRLWKARRGLSGGIDDVVKTDMDPSSKRLQKEQRDKLDHIWTLLHRTL